MIKPISEHFQTSHVSWSYKLTFFAPFHEYLLIMIKSLVFILFKFFHEEIWKLFIFLQQDMGLIIGEEHTMSIAHQWHR